MIASLSLTPDSFRNLATCGDDEGCEAREVEIQFMTTTITIDNSNAIRVNQNGLFEGNIENAFLN